MLKLSKLAVTCHRTNRFTAYLKISVSRSVNGRSVIRLCMLHFFRDTLFSCFAFSFTVHVFFVLYFFHFALFSSCTLLEYRYFFHFLCFPLVSLFSLFPCCIHVLLFSCCTLFIFSFFHVALFSCCTLFMLLFFLVACWSSSCWFCV